MRFLLGPAGPRVWLTATLLAALAQPVAAQQALPPPPIQPGAEPARRAGGRAPVHALRRGQPPAYPRLAGPRQVPHRHAGRCAGARTALYLKNYGPGQLSSITLRGTSARHTAVLWNGFNINLPSLGEADFSLLPVSGTTQIEIQPGPAGATYGNGAVGGTVRLSSAAPPIPGAGAGRARPRPTTAASGWARACSQPASATSSWPCAPA